ncbi:MAG: hypothetical protein ACXU86_11930, partial [Archangium sp.]
MMARTAQVIPSKRVSPPKMMESTVSLEDMTIDQIGEAVNSLASQGSTYQHQIGTLYNHVVDTKKAEGAGYKSAQDYFSKNVKALSQATLSLYGKVARSFSVDICTQYGMYRLRALISYMEATLAALPEDPGTVLVDVPQDNGQVEKKPFSACSVDEVERAMRAKRSPPVEQVPLPDKARLLFFEDSIVRKFDGVAPVRLSSRSEDGKTLLNLQGVPMAEVPRLIQALQEGLEA